MDIESLIIRIGCDTSAIEASIQAIEGNFENLISQFDEIRNKIDENLNNISSGNQEIRNSTDQAAQSAENLGDSYANSLLQVVTGIIAAKAGFFSLSTAVQNYISDVEKVAEETGAYNKKLEEEERKKAQLARVTKEDIELYVKSRYALGKLEDSVLSLTNAFIRSFTPAIDKAVEYLGKIANWVSTNENNIVRFFKVLAGVVLTLLIPAFVRLAATLLANPITWIAALVLGLALVIDDLVTYIEGGDSALEELWQEFGTGQEIGEKLRSVWESLKQVWQENKNSILTFIAALAGFKIISVIIGLINSFGKAIQVFTALLVRNPFTLLFLALADFIAYLVTGKSLLDGLWQKFGTGAQILQKLKNIWNEWWPVLKRCEGVLLAIGAAFLTFNVISGIITGVKALTAAFMGLNVAMLANPIVLILSLIVGAVVLVIYYFDELKAVWNRVVDYIIQKAHELSQWLQSTWNNIVTATTNFCNSILNYFTNLWNSILEGARATWESIKNTIIEKFNSLVEGIKDIGRTIYNTITGIWDSIISFWNGISLYESGKKLLTTFIDGIKEKASAVIDAVKDVFSKVREYLPFSDAKVGPLSTLTLSGQRLISTIGEGAFKGKDQLLETISGIFNSVKDKLSVLLLGEKAIEGGSQNENQEKPESKDTIIEQGKEIVLSEIDIPDADEITIPAPEIQKEAIDIPSATITQKSIEIPAPEIDQDTIAIAAPEIEQETIAIPQAEIEQDELSIPAPEITQDSINIPAPDINNEKFDLPTFEFSDDFIEIPKAEIKAEQESIDVPPPTIEESTISVPPPEIEQERIAIPSPEIDQREKVTFATEIDEEKLSIPAPEITQSEIKNPAPTMEQEKIIVPQSDIEQEKIIVPSPDMEQEEISIPAPEIDMGKIVIPSPDMEQKAIRIPSPNVDQENVFVPSPQIDQGKIVVPTPDIEQEKIIVPTQEIEQGEIAIPVPQVEQENLDISAPNVEQEKIVVTSPNIEQQKIDLPTPNIEQKEIVVTAPDVEQAKIEVPRPDVDQESLAIQAPEIEREKIVVPAPEIEKEQVSIPAPDMRQKDTEVTSQKAGLLDFLTGVFSSFSETATDVIAGKVRNTLDTILNSGNLLSSIAMPLQPELAAASVPPSIVNHEESPITQTITTTINGINVQTQATDAQQIAASLPGAIKNSFDKFDIAASLTGVRQ